MARKRTPLDVARVMGRDTVNPGRFKGRASPAVPALGDPDPKLTSEEKTIWREFQRDFPWLRKSDRAQTAIACNLIARSQSPEGLPVTGQQILLRILNSFGGNPTNGVRRRFME